MAYDTARHPAYGTEYSDNYTADRLQCGTGSWNASASGLFDGRTMGTPRSYPVGPEHDYEYARAPYEQQSASGSGMMTSSARGMASRDPAVFDSQLYPSVYRETVVRKDERGHYIDPFKNIATKPYGRRLMYDKSHPDKMYASQWSSELADHPSCYSFPTTTGLDPEIPFKRDMEWQSEAETGRWPTEHWQRWTKTACSPTYDGHDDQVEYSKYKVQLQVDL